MKTVQTCLVAIPICLSTMLLSPAAFAANPDLATLQKQEALMKRINEAQKAKAITVRQAKNFRRDLSKAAVKKQKIKEHNAKPGVPDQSLEKVEKRLAEIGEELEETKRENAEKAAAAAAEAAEKARKQ